MTSQKIAIGLAVALFAGVVTAHAADYSVGYEAYQRGDYATALRIFRQFDAQGNVKAQASLGSIFQIGEGVPQDFVLAHLWYNLAAARGEKLGRKNRDLLAKLMTPAQIARTSPT